MFIYIIWMSITYTRCTFFKSNAIIYNNLKKNVKINAIRTLLLFLSNNTTSPGYLYNVLVNPFSKHYSHLLTELLHSNFLQVTKTLRTELINRIFFGKRILENQKNIRKY